MISLSESQRAARVAAHCARLNVREADIFYGLFDKYKVNATEP